MRRADGDLTIARVRIALTIAGSDPTGRAGLQQDLQVFRSLGVHGAAVVTALTVQDTVKVHRVLPAFPNVVLEQIRILLRDVTPHAVKLGMLATDDVARMVELGLTEPKRSGPEAPALVIDPVLAASDGTPLLERRAWPTLTRLFPSATLVTPNLPEAALLTDRDVSTAAGVESAARTLLGDLGACAVLVKGGHRDGPPDDLLAEREGDGIAVEWLPGSRIEGGAVHGTGCALAAAVAAGLAAGHLASRRRRPGAALRRRRLSQRLPRGPGRAAPRPAVTDVYTAAAGAAPHALYTERVALRRAEAAGLLRRERWLSNLRLAVFAAGAVMLWGVTSTWNLAAAWLLAPATAFAALVLLHDRAIRERAAAERSTAFYERGLARLEDRWAGGGESGERFTDASHLYAADLDLFGRGSLFELLCTARTRMGEETLAAWLLAPADAGEILARQAAIAELRDRLDLREDLARLGADVRAGVDAAALRAWAAAPAANVPRLARATAAVLATSTLAAAAAWYALGSGPLPFLAVLAAEGIFAARMRPRLLPVIRAAGRPARDLALLAALLARIERERFESTRLAALRASLDSDGEPPSRQVARLRRLLELLEARQNQLFAPVAALLLWSTQLALAIEAWRARSGASIPAWLCAVGEFEALCALASHAFEHPEDPFPALLPGGPRYEAEGLGHPLLPEARSVRNDLHLGSDLRLLVVSGSNMSGKSTWLRTIGVNAVLAFAGAPVRARRMAISPLSVGSSLRILDSLQSGSSKFYAEIMRIGEIVARAGSGTPLLFLLDEILNGTNSHDRRIGAEAIVRSLVERGAIGLVTTHDLALARIADDLAPRAENVHFEDQLEGGEMRFDYRLRPGVVARSNALALMRAVGLEV